MTSLTPRRTSSSTTAELEPHPDAGRDDPAARRAPGAPSGRLYAHRPDRRRHTDAAGPPCIARCWARASRRGSARGDDAADAHHRRRRRPELLPRLRDRGRRGRGRGSRAWSMSAAGSFSIELEPRRGDPERDPLVWCRRCSPRRRAAAIHRGLCRGRSAGEAQATGFDHVMVYRFLPDGSGSVIAETAAEGSESISACAFSLEHSAAGAQALSHQLAAPHSRCALHASADRACASPETGRPLDLCHSALRTFRRYICAYANMACAPPCPCRSSSAAGFCARRLP